MKFLDLLKGKSYLKFYYFVNENTDMVTYLEKPSYLLRAQIVEREDCIEITLANNSDLTKEIFTKIVIYYQNLYPNSKPINIKYVGVSMSFISKLVSDLKFLQFLNESDLKKSELGYSSVSILLVKNARGNTVFQISEVVKHSDLNILKVGLSAHKDELGYSSALDNYIEELAKSISQIEFTRQQQETS